MLGKQKHEHFGQLISLLPPSNGPTIMSRVGKGHQLQCSWGRRRAATKHLALLRGERFQPPAHRCHCTAPKLSLAGGWMERCSAWRWGNRGGYGLPPPWAAHWLDHNCYHQVQYGNKRLVTRCAFKHISIDILWKAISCAAVLCMAESTTQWFNRNEEGGKGENAISKLSIWE